MAEAKRNVRNGHREFTERLLEQVDGTDDKARLKLLQTRLKDRQKKIDRVDEEILELISVSGSPDDCIREVADAGDFKSRVQGTLGQIKEQILELERKEHLLHRMGSQESLSSTASLQTKLVRARLPKLELKKFIGKPYDWQEIWNAFRSSIDENEELADVDKFTYLRHLLEEPAKGVVAGFTLTEANYAAAVNLLKQRIGKPSIIRQAHIS
eukprot:Seg1172.19 transcript_id=Seg1172.19/GoldUCD/mRNA.D3Y31 product="hypothetical protein" protein_id=Seg1172.19/GoldUCD/D3Y31